MTLFMWVLFIGGLILTGVTPWGFLPVVVAIGFWLGGGP